MHFVAMCIHLLPLEEYRPLTPADSGYLQAAVYNAISHENPAAGQTLHDRQRNKEYTLAIVGNTHYGVKLRLTWMGKDGLVYAGLLMTSFAKQPKLRIGNATWQVANVDLADKEWSQVSTWSDLTSPDTGCHLRFAFASPTAIAKRDAERQRFVSLFPDPIDVFSSLLRRWQALHGPTLPHDLDQFIRSGGCVIANYQLQTVEFQTTRYTQIGFVGHAVYYCRNNIALYMTALNALTRLAFFTGVGYQTARGMGAVRVWIEP